MTNLLYQLSYAGVPLLLDVSKIVRINMSRPEKSPPKECEPPRNQQPMAELVEELDRLIPFCSLQDFTLPPNYPGRNLGAIASQWQIGPNPNATLKINEWYYPNTASRWSVFRGLATSSQVNAILSNITGAQSNTWGPANFTMMAAPLSPNNPGGDGSKYKLSTNLFMLPPRPLAEHGGQFDGLYLITLVDERYYFQFNPVSIRVTKDSTWTGLINQIGNVLSINIQFQPLPAAYGTPEPDSQFWTNIENTATLLDAIAYNVGTTVVRNFDGTYNLQTPLASQAIVNTNRGAASSVVRTAGGDIFQGPGTSLKIKDLTPSKNAVLPASVNISFPKYVYGDDPIPHFVNARYANQRPSAWYEESYGDTYIINIPLSQAGSQFSNLVGIVSATHAIHTTAKALYPTEASTTPTNQADLQALALQLAQDYYNAQVASALDEVYPGTLVWVSEGFHDIIWTYSARVHQATTRVMRSEWNQIVREMQHSAPPLPNKTNIPKGVGGPSVAQTIRDSFSNQQTALHTPGVLVPQPISTTLAAELAPGDKQAIFTAVDYFPTQNRWRGQVDNEIIYFDGTSGGIPSPPGFKVTIPFRGIDATIMADHANGATVSQIAPDIQYGVNLVTYEKMQFAYPQEWSSGGVQGVNIVPQLQTVQILDDKGKLINQIKHYSGQVDTYDVTANSGFQWLGQELVWAVERNALSVTSGDYYGGQILGYSAAGPVAPIYGVEIGTGTGGGGTNNFTGFSILNDTFLSTLPCSVPPATKQGGPPYSPSLKTPFSLDLESSPGQANLVTTPLMGQGSVTLVGNNQNPLGPQETNPTIPPALGPGVNVACVDNTLSWWCHQNPAGNYCIPNQLLQPGDTGVTGPFPNQQACQTSCGGTQTPFWCHKNPAGNYCSSDSSLQPGDLDVTGPYPSQSICQTICAAATIVNGPNGPMSIGGGILYSTTPGINWLVSYTDPSLCTVSLEPIISYPPPSMLTSFNNTFYGPGAGGGGGGGSRPGGSDVYTPYPLNFKNSCTITWLAQVNAGCRTIDVTANWNGLFILFSINGMLNGVDTLKFDGKDFIIQPIAGTCPFLQGISIKTGGITANVAYLDPSCVAHTMQFVDGLFQGVF